MAHRAGHVEQVGVAIGHAKAGAASGSTRAQANRLRPGKRYITTSQAADAPSAVAPTATMAPRAAEVAP